MHTKKLRIGSVIAVVIWLGLRLLDSYSIGNFAYRIGSDLGLLASLALPLLGVAGFVYLLTRLIPHRRT